MSDNVVEAARREAFSRLDPLTAAACTDALPLEQTGRTGVAPDAWPDLFGPRFAKS
jgi:hypothetical protein